ncbi:MAG: hypothetical protein R6W77_02475 [Trueperaceae bacterium]
MLVPRRLDQEGLRAYLDEVRPRFLVVRVRVERRTFAWGFPLSALEEIVGFALGAAAFAQAVRSWLPERWQAVMNGASTALLQALRLGSRGGAPDSDGGDGGATKAAGGDDLVPPDPSTSPARVVASALPSALDGSATSATSASSASSTSQTSQTSSTSPSPASALWATANDLAGGALRDVLRVPPGEPYVSVRSGRALIDVVAY